MAVFQMNSGFWDTYFRCCCNLLEQSVVNKVMETRNENLAQSNGNVYEELHEVLMKYEKSLESLNKALSQLSMYLLGERLFLEEMERVEVMGNSICKVSEFLENELYNKGEKSSSD